MFKAQRSNIHCTPNTAHSTMHNVHCKLHTAHCTLHTAHFTAPPAEPCPPYPLRRRAGRPRGTAATPHLSTRGGWKLYTTLYTVHCTLYTVHCTLYTVHCTLYTVHCTYSVHNKVLPRPPPYNYLPTRAKWTDKTGPGPGWTLDYDKTGPDRLLTDKTGPAWTLDYDIIGLSLNWYNNGP